MLSRAARHVSSAGRAFGRPMHPESRWNAKAARVRHHSAAASKLPDEVDVVVIGGGSLGASTLYHLADKGVNAVLVEKNELTSGTTWHSAGMLWNLRPDDSGQELSQYSKKMCLQLEEETGINSWTENGGLWIACNEERLNEYRRLSETGKYFGVESHVVSAAEAVEIHPMLSTTDVYGALYIPTDGSIDPTSIVNAYVKAAKTRGGRVFEHTPVSGIETVRETTVGGHSVVRVVAVEVNGGHRIKTQAVVNATGAWAEKVSAMVGAEIPLRAMKHAMVMTEALPGMHAGLPNVRDHDLSVYLKTQGDAICLGGYEQNPEFCDPDTMGSFHLFNLDWDTFNQNLEGHLKRAPIVETTGIKSEICGPESFTPDHKPLMGPQPGTRGFYQACGFNSMGMLSGGGCGREIASWVIHGAPTIDMFSFDVARFHPDSVRDPRWVVDRTHESYARTYAVVFPRDEALAGREGAGQRRSAVHEALVARGCVHQQRHGFERPGWFDVTPSSKGDGKLTVNGETVPRHYDYYGAYADGNAWRISEARGGEDLPAHVEGEHRYHKLIEGECTYGWPASHATVAEECRAAREGAAIFDQSYFGKFHVGGPGADAAVQWLVGADMEGRMVGSVVYTTLCNAQGGVEADLTVSKLVDGRYYFCAGGNTMTKDLDWMQRVFEKAPSALAEVTLTDDSKDFTILSVQGPHSRTLLSSLITSPHSLSDEAIPFGACLEDVAFAGHTGVRVLRLTFVGELGYELHVPASKAAEFYASLRDAGERYEAEHGVPVRDAGYHAIDSLSAEKSYRHWHGDLCNRDTPMEAGIGFTVLPKLKKGIPFMGAEALQTKRAAGLQRKLICLTLDDPDVVLHNFETIWRADLPERPIGYVRSTAYGHTLGRTVAYGYVDCPKGVDKITNKWLSEGAWSVGAVGRSHAATLHLKAPFDPGNARVAGNYALEEIDSRGVPLTGPTSVQETTRKLSF